MRRKTQRSFPRRGGLWWSPYDEGCWLVPSGCRRVLGHRREGSGRSVLRQIKIKIKKFLIVGKEWTRRCRVHRYVVKQGLRPVKCIRTSRTFYKGVTNGWRPFHPQKFGRSVSSCEATFAYPEISNSRFVPFSTSVVSILRTTTLGSFSTLESGRLEVYLRVLLSNKSTERPSTQRSSNLSQMDYSVRPKNRLRPGYPIFYIRFFLQST